jgi:hypothetical protein
MVVPSFFSGGAKGLIKTAHNLERVGESSRPLRNLASDLVGALKRGEDDMAELIADLPCPSAPGAGFSKPSPLSPPSLGIMSFAGGEAVPGLGLGRDRPRPDVFAAPCIRSLGTITAEVVERSRTNLEALRRGNVGFGAAPRQDYAKTFRQHYANYNDQIGQVHHAVEQDVLTRYPGVVTDSEMHSLQNLRGIPTGPVGTDLHQSKLRMAWDMFYQQMEAMGRAPTKTELLNQARRVDDMFGGQFVPPIR